MPVFDQGYRPYEGRLRGRVLRGWPISWNCLRSVKRWPFVVAIVAGAIPLIVKLTQAYMIGNLDQFGRVGNRLGGFDDEFFFEMTSWEIFFTVLMLVVVGAGQIADDVRSGALQLYFGKPITQLDYVLGKVGTVVLAASILTVIPGILLLIGVAAFAPDWSFLTANPWLPLKVVAFALLVSVVLGCLSLGLSSMGRRGWIIGVAFFGGYVFSSGLGKAMPAILRDRRWEAIHLGNCLDAAGMTLFTGNTHAAASAGLVWGILGGVLVVSIALLTRRVRAVEVVS